MTKKAKDIVELFPNLSLNELWVIAEAALAQVRVKTASDFPLPPMPEVNPEEWQAEMTRRYEQIISGEVAEVPGETVADKARTIAP